MLSTALSYHSCLTADVHLQFAPWSHLNQVIQELPMTVWPRQLLLVVYHTILMHARKMHIVGGRVSG
jgi:hypothetical protein